MEVAGGDLAAIRQTVAGGATSPGATSTPARPGLPETGGGTSSIGFVLLLLAHIARVALRGTVGSHT